MTSLPRTVQSLQPGDLVELFDLDLSPLGLAEVWRFTPTPALDGSGLVTGVVWRGNTYVPADVEASGFEMTGQGQIPQPTLKVSNVTLYMAGLVLAHDDAVGCKLTRWRVFAQYLDGGAEADPDAHFPPDVYEVQQKTSQNRLSIEWKLSAATDQDGKMLPARTVVRDSCPWSYRRWKAASSSFDYGDVECPYTAMAMFTAAGDATTDPTKDVCGRKLTDCVARFGDGNELPFGGFPGVGLNRISG